MIEGIDGAGKGTQTELLAASLKSVGREVVILSFPRYQKTFFGKRVGDFLNGRFGSLDQVHPFLASLLYAGDRFESRQLLSEALSRGKIVICDRYVTSNLAHQLIKAPQAAREEMKEWIEQVEYEVFGLPRPDLILLLDTTAETATALIDRKSTREYTTAKADMHEADQDYLRSVLYEYRAMAAGNLDWRVIPCLEDSVLRTKTSIAADIFHTVQQFLATPSLPATQYP